MRRTVALMIVGLASGVAGLPSVVNACSPKCNPDVLPDSETKDVPANTKIWVLGGAMPRAIVRGRFARTCGTKSEPELQTEDGTLVPWTMERVTGGVAFTPDTPLQIGRRYVIKLECPQENFGDVDFEVTAPADSTPPDTPRLSLGGFVDEADDCWKLTYRRVSVAGGDALVQVDVAFSDGNWGAAGGITDSLSQLGHAGCGRGYWTPELRSAAVRIAAIDLAGNRSPWSEETVVSPVGGLTGAARRWLGCNCRAARGEDGRARWLALALLVLVRRRSAGQHR